MLKKDFMRSSAWIKNYRKNTIWTFFTLHSKVLALREFLSSVLILQHAIYVIIRNFNGVKNCSIYFFLCHFVYTQTHNMLKESY